MSFWLHLAYPVSWLSTRLTLVLVWRMCRHSLTICVAHHGRGTVALLMHCTRPWASLVTKHRTPLMSAARRRPNKITSASISISSSEIAGSAATCSTLPDVSLPTTAAQDEFWQMLASTLNLNSFWAGRIQWCCAEVVSDLRGAFRRVPTGQGDEAATIAVTVSTGNDFLRWLAR